MEAILSGWAAALKDSRIIAAMNAGVRATIHLLGDILDEWLQTVVPAYKAAVIMCATASEVGLYDCDSRRINLRDDVLTEILRKTGAYGMIRYAVRTWQRIPAALRYNAAEMLEGGAAVAAVLEDPNFHTTFDALTESSKLTGQSVRPIVDALWDGRIPSVPYGNWVKSITTVDPDAAVQKLVDYGLAANAAQASVVRAPLSAAFGDVGGTVAAWVVNPFGELAASVPGAAGTVVDTAKDAVDTLSDAVDSLNPF